MSNKGSKETAYSVIFPGFDPSRHVLSVDHIPEWFATGDLIVHRDGRTFARALTQTAPRWRQYGRRLKRLLKPSEKKK